MRWVTAIVLAVVVLAVASGLRGRTAASDQTDPGPVLLELNPPLLAEPMNQWPEEAALAWEDATQDEEEMSEKETFEQDESSPGETDSYKTAFEEETEVDTPID